MQVHLIDGSFPGQGSFTLAGENTGAHPRHFQWSRTPCKSKYTWYTDMMLHNAIYDKGDKVALLIEPPSLSGKHYQTVLELQKYFSYVLTFRLDILEQLGEKGLFYPLGGSWIAPENQGVQEKSKRVCIIVSEKTKAEGHKMRHSTVRFLADRFQIDVFGRGYISFPKKSEVLSPYQYAIIVESWTGKDYFSEKLIDAISMHCLPIYCGCPNIGDYFNVNGMLRFDTLSQLEHILIEVVSDHHYQNRIAAILENAIRAKEFMCAEDWIWKHYGFLF